MIHSMTGFGKAELQLEDKKLTIEVRSLNSKQADINVRIPSIYREKEIVLRKQLSNQLKRGKIDFNLYMEVTGNIGNYQLNKELIESFQEQLAGLNLPGQEAPRDYLSVLMRMPDVLKNERPTLDEEEWKKIEAVIAEAITNLNAFRLQEGEAMAVDLKERVETIQNLLSQVEPLEQERIQKVKSRLQENLDKLEDVSVDNNRFEQEIIYYLEKFDVTEEKVRLKNHCDYFVEMMNASESQGRKLGFICQEMGREINTLGSKANHEGIQKIVVEMKDNLEKIKEQILNIL